MARWRRTPSAPAAQPRLREPPAVHSVLALLKVRQTQIQRFAHVVLHVLQIGDINHNPAALWQS
jgi:hypothetical protein